MGWFSRSEIETQNETLKADNERLKADLAAAQSQTTTATELTQELATAKEELESCKAALSTEESAHEATKSELHSAKAACLPGAIAETITAAFALEDTDENKATREANKPITDAVQAEVSRQVAATGRPPVEFTEKDRNKSETKTATRAEFNAMTPHARAEFIKNGGRPID